MRLDLVKGSHTFSVPRILIAKASPEFDVFLLNGGGNKRELDTIDGCAFVSSIDDRFVFSQSGVDRR